MQSWNIIASAGSIPVVALGVMIWCCFGRRKRASDDAKQNVEKAAASEVKPCSDPETPRHQVIAEEEFHDCETPEERERYAFYDADGNVEITGTRAPVKLTACFDKCSLIAFN
jgi:hypothetical protein